MSVALLVAESVWFSPKENKGQASFRSYAESIERLLCFDSNNNSFNYYHASFYDAKSFDSAMNHLKETDEERQILYVGGHGDGKKVAEASIKKIGEGIAKNGKKIKGLVLSSCWGGSSDSIANTTNWGVDDSGKVAHGPNWIVAYSDSVDWHLSAMLEFHLLYCMSKVYCDNPLSMNKGDNLIDEFVNVLSAFSGEMPVGCNKGELKNVIRVWIRPKGASFSREITSEIITKLNW